MIVRCYAEFGANYPKVVPWKHDYEPDWTAGRELAVIVTDVLKAQGCIVEGPEEEPEHGWQFWGTFRGKRIFGQVNESFDEDDEWMLSLRPGGLGYDLFGRIPATHAELLASLGEALDADPRLWNLRWLTQKEKFRQPGCPGAPNPVTP